MTKNAARLRPLSPQPALLRPRQPRQPPRPGPSPGRWPCPQGAHASRSEFCPRNQLGLRRVDYKSAIFIIVMSLINHSCARRRQNGAVPRAHQLPRGRQGRVHGPASSPNPWRQLLARELLAPGRAVPLWNCLSSVLNNKKGYHLIFLQRGDQYTVLQTA